MTIALAFPGAARLRFGLEPHDLGRGLAAGSLWGVATAGGLMAWQMAQCGFVCPQQALTMTGLSLLVGVATFGPLAAFGPRRRTDRS